MKTQTRKPAKRRPRPKGPPRRLVVNLRRANVKIYHVGAEDHPILAEQPIEIELVQHKRLRQPIMNMEKWQYDENQRALIVVIAMLYKSGVDCTTEAFENGIIRSHDQLMKEALVDEE